MAQKFAIKRSSRWNVRSFFILSFLVAILGLTIVIMQSSGATQTSSNASGKECLPRPACLDASPACTLPKENWCPPTVTPSVSSCSQCDSFRPFSCTNKVTNKTYCLPVDIKSSDFSCVRCQPQS